MKYLYSILFVCLVVSSNALARIDSTATEASSPTTLSPEVFISGGVPIAYLPVGFRKQAVKAWNMSAGYGYSFEQGSLGYSSLLASIEYNLIHFDETGYKNFILSGPDSNTILSNPNFAASQRPTKIFSILVHYKGTFCVDKGSIAPYFLVGLGYMYISVPPLITSSDSGIAFNSSSISWTFGIGVDVPVTDSAVLFIQARSVLGVLDPPRQIFPITGGLRYRL